MAQRVVRRSGLHIGLVCCELVFLALYGQLQLSLELLWSVCRQRQLDDSGRRYRRPIVLRWTAPRGDRLSVFDGRANPDGFLCRSGFNATCQNEQEKQLMQQTGFQGRVFYLGGSLCPENEWLTMGGY